MNNFRQHSGADMKRTFLALAGAGALTLAGCTTADMQMLNAALEQTAYEMQQTNQGYYNNGYNNPYTNAYNNANPYAPRINNTIGNTWVGYNQCNYTGTRYSCDTTGDGYADMYGNSQDGTYSSSHLRVNGYGEAYTRGSNGQWVRNPAYDDPPPNTRPERNNGHHNGHYNGGYNPKQ
tara:strand:+ start:44848 stop:45381 length:534 start_codon:yes stop_codon:yes gene_type:complete